MGIDVYLEWDDMTEEDKKARITGFSIHHGHVGYLREAYHGSPYATAILISENWDDQPEEGFTIPAAELRRRLPATVMATLYRHHVVYGERLDDPAVVEIDGGDLQLMRLLKGAVEEAQATRNRNHPEQAPEPNGEQVRAVTALIEKRQLPDYALSYVDFVALAEKQERLTGKPCRIVVSF